ncbi:MAG: hypothetical protein QNJ54_27860 [Prochloraceae cyanobacterium]|nr:hypothetical protein [Prochloraceae cyanobacterium]
MSDLSNCVEILFTSLLALMPTIYQKESLEAILGLLLEATGISRASNWGMATIR